MNDEKPKIRAKTVIEMLGKPKSHVEETLNNYLKLIKEDKNFIIIKEELVEAQEQDDGMFSTFVELEIETDEINKLTGFCFDYMPSSIEIVSPAEITFKANDLSNTMNDLQAKLHTMDMAVKKLKNENKFIKRNTNTLILNLIKVTLLNKRLTAEQISKGIGINAEELQSFLNVLEKDNQIMKNEDNTYNIKKRDEDGGVKTTN